jgi:hypothetical protein
MIKLATTYETKDLHSYFEALTKARPYPKSTALWYRLPETLK